MHGQKNIKKTIYGVIPVSYVGWILCFVLRDNTFRPCYKPNCDVIKTTHRGDKISCYNSVNGVKSRRIRKRDNFQQKKDVNTNT